MNSYLRFGLRVLIWSLFLSVAVGHFTTSLNPFLGSVVSFLCLIAVVVQLILLRRNGFLYVCLFFLSVVALTYGIMYVDDLLFDYPRRYYSIH
ncbi:hypothetical protein [Fibrella arboris]|uniref:hypothetical protein n=1 Tax=Fibrella arboris TaxID=3242486 RepID=UPI0035219DC3